MATIKNEDLKIMADVEWLLHKKLEETNGIKDTFNGKEYYYFNENDEEYEIWIKYWNMVERFIQDKQSVTDRHNKWNKDHRELHRIYNNISANNKSGNKEKLKYWKNKLKEYREKEG